MELLMNIFKQQLLLIVEFCVNRGTTPTSPALPCSTFFFQTLLHGTNSLESQSLFMNVVQINVAVKEWANIWLNTLLYSDNVQYY